MTHNRLPTRIFEARSCPQSAERRRIRVRLDCGAMFLFVFVVGLVVGVGTPAEAFASKRAGGSYQTTHREPSSRIRREGRVIVAPLEVPLNRSDNPDLLTSQQQQEQQLPVLTQDLVDLSDLRYDEWVATADTEDEGEASVPSRYAFRMATAEIALERSQAGAVSFLARWESHPKESNATSSSVAVAVGAAELSPIELEGAVVRQEDSSQNRNRVRWYVTDVVTSSKHRRMGIANRLMDALERHAYHHTFGTTTTNPKEGELTPTPSCVTLYLHVKEGNDAALGFYENPQRGYASPTDAELEGLDPQHLAQNAGTTGQMLLCKTLNHDTHLPPPPPYEDDVLAPTAGDVASTAATTTGFGNRSARVAKPKAKKKKPKRKKK